VHAHYEVQQADLLPGLGLGNSELTGDPIFADDAQPLTR